ncbi:hypothetical protein [Xanthomonas theicola]|nr:hypothetical protein [Xanthomonas theicola]QNH24980.1 hypothetical protein G4Q83_09820 [Xanthomonas theicola]
MVHNRVRGPIPWQITPGLESIADLGVGNSLPGLLHLMEGSGRITSDFPPEQEAMLLDLMQSTVGVRMRPFQVISKPQIAGIVEAVRQRVLDWLLDLEAKGVLGEGLSFNEPGKQIVSQQSYNFQNLTSSQIQINTEGSQQNQGLHDTPALGALIRLLEDALRNDVGILDPTGELRADVQTLKAQASSPKPKWDIIKATAKSMKSVLENAAGSVIAVQAAPLLATILNFPPG